MPKGATIYLSFHEPRRLRIPAVSIPNREKLRDSIIDRRSTEQFYRNWLENVCQPYSQALRQAMAEGATFVINVSGPLLEALATSRGGTALSFIEILRHPRVAFVCSEAKHSLSYYLDVDQFVKQMKRSYDLAISQGILPVGAVAPHMCLSADIYYALARLPVSFIVADGSRDVLGGRSSAFFRRNGWGPLILTRNSELSLRVWSMLNAPPEPMFELRAAEVAQQVAESEGDCVLLGWQVPSCADQRVVEGGLRFLERLCSELLSRDVEFIDVKRLVDGKLFSSSSLPLTAMPAVSAEYGSLSYFLGHPVQQSILGLMHQAYSVAQLTGNEEVVEHALDLAQWDLLSLVHRLLMSNGHGQEPSYLTAEQWNRLGGNAVIGEIHKVMENFIVSVTKFYC